MPMEREKLLFLVEKLDPLYRQIPPTATEKCFLVERQFYDLGLPPKRPKFSDSLTITTDPREQLMNLLPIFSPDLRSFVSKLVTEDGEYRRVFTNADEIFLFYCYFSMAIAAQHIDMILYEDRAATFRNKEPFWPFTGHLSAEKMAVWGFFRREPYEKQQTTCFACGCVLSDWIPSDTSLDGHAQFRPQCSFMWLMVFLYKAYQHDSSTSNAREVQSVNTHSRLWADQVPRRLQKLLVWSQATELPAAQLVEKEMQSYVIGRDLFRHSSVDLLFTMWKKVFRYWNTQKTVVTERDLVIDVKHLFPTGANLVKDALQNRRNAARLPYIPGGMPPNSQFVYPPNDGGLSVVHYLSSCLNFPLEAGSVLPNMSSESVYIGQASHGGLGVISNSSLNPPVVHNPPVVPLQTPIIASRIVTPSPVTATSTPPPVITAAPTLAVPSVSRDRVPEASSTNTASRQTSESLLPNVEKALASRICVKCMRKSAVYLILPCRHLALCSDCGMDTRTMTNCPACKKYISDVIRVYTS